jgi:hypothetical protein
MPSSRINELAPEIIILGSAVLILLALVFCFVMSFAGAPTPW